MMAPDHVMTPHVLVDHVVVGGLRHG
jgi:acyl CoA:acetate/3-ketoacid CoA transferase alpha subunit